MSAICIRAVLVGSMLPLALGMQGRTSRRAHKVVQPSEDTASEDTEALPSKFLDENEVNDRGSHCMDGSVPIFHHKEGSSDGKWVFWIKANGVCANLTHCLDFNPENDDSPDSAKPLQTYGDFSEYHHVVISNCDDGYYLGSVDSPSVANGSKMYFQGGRIIKHVVDTLSANYSMTDVLFAGGSGGGLSIYSGAYLLKSIMPDTVERFGVVPINGWYQEDPVEDIEAGFLFQHMAENVNPECKNDNVGTEADCMRPNVSYGYGGDVNMFIVQVFDYTFNKENPDVYDDWKACIQSDSPTTSECTDEMAANVAKFWNDYVSSFSKYARYNTPGQGGFLSTCVSHTFYNDEEDFNAFQSDGVTVGEAVWNWWESLKTNSPAQWYLPCTMGSTAETLQCESSCGSSV